MLCVCLFVLRSPKIHLVRLSGSIRWIYMCRTLAANDGSFICGAAHGKSIPVISYKKFNSANAHAAVFPFHGAPLLSLSLSPSPPSTNPLWMTVAYTLHALPFYLFYLFFVFFCSEFSFSLVLVRWLAGWLALSLIQCRCVPPVCVFSFCFNFYPVSDVKFNHRWMKSHRT